MITLTQDEVCLIKAIRYSVDLYKNGDKADKRAAIGIRHSAYLDLFERQVAEVSGRNNDKIEAEESKKASTTHH